jgi:hypothetical protein
MNRAVAFHDLVGAESGFLELPIYIGGIYERAMLALRAPFSQHLKSGVRLGMAIQQQTMAVKAPRQLRVREKMFGLGNVEKGEIVLPQRRVMLPETLFAPEIRQARVHAHTGTGGNQQ